MKTCIIALRKERGLSQAELARELGVTRQTIISIENERYTASLVLAHRIARLFGKAIEDIFDFSDVEE